MNSLSLILFLFTLLALVSSEDLDNQQSYSYFPNIAYLGKGYDIFYGNPRSTTYGGDPGFRSQIFDMSQYSQAKTGDNEYYLPIGVGVAMCESCNLRAGYSEIVSSQGYMNDVKNSISVGGSGSYDGISAEFTASTTWEDMYQYTQTDSNVVASTTVFCSMYCASMNLGPVGTSPILTSDFIDWINYLPSTYDADIYSEFVETYGTHVPRSEKFGAMYGMYFILSTLDFMSMVKEGINVDIAASISAFGAKASTSWGYQENQEWTTKFNSKVSETFAYSVGAPFPKNDENFASTWSHSTRNAPAPLYLEVVPIESLINSKLFPTLNASRLANITANIQQFKQGYCQLLNSAGELTGVDANCTLIPTTVTPPPPPATCRLCESCGGSYPSDQGSSVHQNDWGPYMMYGQSCGGNYQSSWGEAHLCCNGDSTNPPQGCTFCASACGGTYPYEAGRRLNQGDYGYWRTRNPGCVGDASALNDIRETVLCCKTDINNCKWCAGGCGKMFEAGRRLNQGDYGPYNAFGEKDCTTDKMPSLVEQTWRETVLCCPS